MILGLVWQNFDSFESAIFFVAVFFCAVWLICCVSVLSLKTIFGKLDFFRVSYAFCMSSLASCTCVTLSVWDCFFEQSIFPFAGGFLCHCGSERLSSLSDDPCHRSVDSVFCFSGLFSGCVLLSSEGKKPPLNPRVFDRLFISQRIRWTVFWTGLNVSIEWQRADCLLAIFEWEWNRIPVRNWPWVESLECSFVNWVFDTAFNNLLFSARFLISSYGALFWLARLFRMTLSLNSRLFMNALFDATTNSSSYWLGGFANTTGFHGITIRCHWIVFCFETLRL